MNPLRRLLLQSSTGIALLPWLGSGLLTPTRVLAAEWKRPAFTAKTVPDALKSQGWALPLETRDILIQAPEIAENGAKVDIEISSTLPGARSLLVFADKNPFPLCASLEFYPPALPFARIQVKLAETTRIRAILRTSDDKTYVAMKEIKITLGGCGG